MEFLKDTIVAIATPHGRGALSVIRVSGDLTLKILKNRFISRDGKSLSHRKISFGNFLDGEGNEIDEVGVIFYKSPNSYTGDDMAEITCHGSPVITSTILDTLIKSGCRIANPGEFTARRYLSGKIDLSQAEAVNDIVNATTRFQARVAEYMLKGGISKKILPLKDKILSILVEIETEVEFSEENVFTLDRNSLLKEIEDILNTLLKLKEGFKRGDIIKHGISVCIVGRPNVGKSSLFNAILERERAIISEEAGTTRDYIVESANISGIPINIVDTAGIRISEDLIEHEGIKRTYEKIEEADIVLVVFDISQPPSREDFKVFEELKDKSFFVVFNKIDLPDKFDLSSFIRDRSFDFCGVSAKYGYGIHLLKRKIVERVLGGEIDERKDVFFITSKRQQKCILDSIHFLKKAKEDILLGVPEEYISYHLRKASESLSEIFGEISTEDILNQIFSNFCIGK